jgi:hypothetical protein
MPRYNKRTDDNQKQIVSELRSFGYTVKDTSKMGWGFADILVAKDRRAIAVEIKTKGKRGRVTDKEIELRVWLEQLGMKYIVAESTEEILKAFKL